MEKAETKAADRRFFALQPLVAVAALLVLGMACSRAAGGSPGLGLGLVATGCAVAIAALWRRWALVSIAGLAAAIFFSGATLWRLDESYVAANHVARLLQPGAPTLLTVRVRVLTDPQVSPPSPDLPFYLARPSTHFIAETEQILSTHGWMPGSGTVTVSVKAALKAQRGERLEICGWGMRPGPPANPGEFDYARYLAASGIHASIFATCAEQVQVIGAPAAVGPRAWLDDFRGYLRRRLLENVAPADCDAGNTMAALLLGYRDPGMQPITQAFSDAGVAHLLALSGTHIVLMALFFSWMLRLIVPRPRRRAVMTALLVAVYVAATPGGPPILRAGIGMLLFCAANLLTRRVQPANLLAATCLIVLAWRPGDLCDAGFQLSFIATAGLILLWPRLHAAVFARYLERRAAIARAIGTRWAAWRERAVRYLCHAISLNAVGSLISVPLVAYHFNQFNALSIITGLVALPLVAVTMLVALVQLLASLIAAPAGAAIADLTAWCGTALVAVIGALARLPGATCAVRSPPWYALVLAYAVVILWLARRRIGWSRATIATAGAMVLAVAVAWYAITQRGGAHLWQLDVGRGSCLVVESPDGRVMVINAGSPNRPEIAQRVIAPFLKHAGIDRIDALLVTQVDDARANAAGDLLERYHPRAVYCTGADLERRAGLAATRFLGSIRHAGLTPRALHAGDRLTLGAALHCDILWPPERPLSAVPPTQSAMILRLSLGDSAVLLTGPAQDIGLAASAAAAPPQPVGGVLLMLPAETTPAVRTFLGMHGAPLLVIPPAEAAPTDDSLVDDASTGAADPSALRPRRTNGCVQLRMDGRTLQFQRLQP